MRTCSALSSIFQRGATNVFTPAIAAEVGFERTALVPRTEHVPGDSAGASCKDEKRAYNTAHHHRASLPHEIDR